MIVTADARAIRGKNRLSGWIIGCLVALIVVGGAVYIIMYSNTLADPPSLPAGPPSATALASSAKTDILQGNFVLTTALYRTSESPTSAISYYRTLLASHPHQIGRFATVGTTILPSRAPEALQHIPPVFARDVSSDARAARYLYTQYSDGQSDIGIAIDVRRQSGPTYVYLEMLTLPGS